MRNRKKLVVWALAISLAGLLTGCKGKTEETAEVTPVPEVTVTPEATPTPTITPDAQTTIYKSANKKVSIELPDATWSNRIDQDDMLSFQSPDAGSILILHGQGEEDLSVEVFPNTEDMATTLEQASGMEPGKDFQIQDYTSGEVNGVGIYSYTVKMLNLEKSEGNAYVIHRVFAGSDEYYNLTGTVKAESALEGIREAMDSFAITGKSPLKKAVSAWASGEADQTETSGTSGTSDLKSPSSGEISEEAMSDTNLTRTIYRNSDGMPLVIQPDGNGNWVDIQGNVYEFYNDEDVYDQNGVDYYYGGEAADVYYMPISEE